MCERKGLKYRSDNHVLLLWPSIIIKVPNGGFYSDAKEELQKNLLLNDSSYFPKCKEHLNNLKNLFSLCNGNCPWMLKVKVIRKKV